MAIGQKNAEDESGGIIIGDSVTIGVMTFVKKDVPVNSVV